MGDPKRKKKEYEAPKRLWEKTRIEEEKALREEYGLKNARELWKTKTILRKMRREARRLLAGRGAKIDERKTQLLGRVTSFLIRNPQATIDDILALKERDVLERRLQSLVCRKGFAKTFRQSRQFIAHGHIAVEGNRMSCPSYLVKFSEEGTIGWYNEPIQIEAAPAGEAAGAAGVGAAGGAGEKAVTA
ncbi:MAG: 30S ribosomal protein S4 [Candidatus Micrarchaeota archaeon]|nr:30S ribosomal protein S4 [Candidatus Micrarchaeota archaeon]